MTTVLWLHNFYLLLSFACISPGVSSCVVKSRFRYFPLICASMKLLCLCSSFWIYRGVIVVFLCLCSDSGFLVKRPSESQGLGGMSPWADRTLGDKGAVVLHSCVFLLRKLCWGFYFLSCCLLTQKRRNVCSCLCESGAWICWEDASVHGWWCHHPALSLQAHIL